MPKFCSECGLLIIIFVIILLSAGCTFLKSRPSSTSQNPLIEKVPLHVYTSIEPLFLDLKQIEGEWKLFYTGILNVSVTNEGNWNTKDLFIDIYIKSDRSLATAAPYYSKKYHLGIIPPSHTKTINETIIFEVSDDESTGRGDGHLTVDFSIPGYEVI
jgi:hypothetical protein